MTHGRDQETEAGCYLFQKVSLLVRLEISMNDSVRVKIFNGENCLSHVESSQIQGQGSGILQQRRTITALDVLQEHAQVIPGLEGAVEGDDKRIVRHRQNVSFSKDLQGYSKLSFRYLIDLIPKHQRVLVHLLQGETLTSLTMPNEVDGSIGAIAHQLKSESFRRDN